MLSMSTCFGPPPGEVDDYSPVLLPYIERLPSSRIVKVSEGNVEGSETSALETYCMLVRQVSVDSLAMGLE